MRHGQKFHLLLGLAIALTFPCLTSSSQGKEAAKPRTFCNPIDIEYRYMINEPCRREAADPVIVTYKGEYYLFASKSGGYWHSKDLRDWKLVEIADGVLPIEDYAPAVLVVGDAIIYQAGVKFFKSTDPLAGKWEKVIELPGGYGDPALFQDDDGKVYLYYGCQPVGFLGVTELDKNFKPVGQAKDTLQALPKIHGWEQSGTAGFPINTFPDSHVTSSSAQTYYEGSWMNKHNGIYYLQYAAPGTQWQIYGDGVYTAKSPMGPFTYAPNNPISYKPTGFIGGAGHSCTFQEMGKNRFWHVSTMVVADKEWFERRLGIFPTGFDKDDVMHVNTYLGDYPQFVAGKKGHPEEDNFAGWMLLSYGKKAEASSTLDDAHGTEKAFDENVRSIWSAKSGDKGEWLSVDLGKPCRVNAIQVNFADQDARAFGRKEKLSHQYLLEASLDGKAWTTIVDKSLNQKDVPHDYVELDKPVKARFVKLSNVHFPAQGKFSIRDLRVFGNGQGKAPARVEAITVERNKADERKATISWQPAEGAEGYIIRYGIAPDKLYSNYQIRAGGPVELNCLNIGVNYYFTIDAFNDSGLTRGKKTQAGPAQ